MLTRLALGSSNIVTGWDHGHPALCDNGLEKGLESKGSLIGLHKKREIASHSRETVHGTGARKTGLPFCMELLDDTTTY